MSERTVLILLQEESQRAQLQVAKTVKKLEADGAKLRWETFDAFQEGKRLSTYDAVFAVLLDMSGDDLGMSEEFYQYYASAPVFFAFTAGDEEVSDMLKGWNDKVTIKAAADQDKFSEDIAASYSEAKTLYSKLLEDDVKPAFKEFDKDGSGSIDKAELKELSKKLGNELNDDELETALKDLDVNKDGVIDINEFARWYFSGMKSYGSKKRSMLQFQGHALKIFEKTKEQAKLALSGQQLKTKSHKFAVSFNDPTDNNGSKIEHSMFIGGQTYKDTLNELSGWLNDTTDKKLVAEAYRSSEEVLQVKHFFEIRVNTSNAQEKAAKLNEFKDKAIAYLKDAEYGMGSLLCLMPQIKADDNHVFIGIEFYDPNHLTEQFPGPGFTDLIDMFKDVEQKICFQIALGTDIKTILSEEEKETPLLKHLAKGFKVSSQITLVSNLKKAILELLKSEVEEEQEIAQKLMIAAPAFLFGINANMDIEFDDFEEIAEHPMAGPAMATFEQLFEGLLEASPDEFLNKKLDLSACDDPENFKKEMGFFNELIETFCDLCEPAFNTITIKSANATLPFSSDTTIHSESIGTVLKLALKIALQKFAVKSSHAFEKELEEIYHD